MGPDIVVHDTEGSSLVMLETKSERAEGWLKDHTEGQWVGPALAVERRFVGPLLMGLSGEGFKAVLRVSGTEVAK